MIHLPYIYYIIIDGHPTIIDRLITLDKSQIPML